MVGSEIKICCKMNLDPLPWFGSSHTYCILFRRKAKHSQALQGLRVPPPKKKGAPQKEEDQKKRDERFGFAELARGREKKWALADDPLQAKKEA